MSLVGALHDLHARQVYTCVFLVPSIPRLKISFWFLSVHSLFAAQSGRSSARVKSNDEKSTKSMQDLTWVARVTYTSNECHMQWIHFYILHFR